MNSSSPRPLICSIINYVGGTESWRSNVLLEGDLLAGTYSFSATGPVEVVFARAGLGTLMVDAIRERDYSVIQGFVLFVGSIFVVTNLLVDLMYSKLDPRVRSGWEPEKPRVGL